MTNALGGSLFCTICAVSDDDGTRCRLCARTTSPERRREVTFDEWLASRDMEKFGHELVRVEERHAHRTTVHPAWTILILLASNMLWIATALALLSGGSR